ncbi:hypothetical protein KFK09_013449 [Dendrobium nobile]|uniref:Uncharacterized protein n=1 Tax=Dendrobium nobile TaxID=94219 RepID=A0A8T3B7G7_DENNO|nr:hypothetical protein KFK09_013449 [Dendrobium nobile]
MDSQHLWKISFASCNSSLPMSSRFFLIALEFNCLNFNLLVALALPPLGRSLFTAGCGRSGQTQELIEVQT